MNRTRKATALERDSDDRSPGLIVSLSPEVPALVSIGTAQNGDDSRGKKNHIASASGTA